CLAPPFFSMLIALRVTAWRLELDPAGPELERMRRAYLEPWGRFGSPGALREGLDVALRVGRLTRALSWRRILDGAGGDPSGEYSDAVSDWLQEVRDGLVDSGP
ncbi:MAG: hypothetical protein ACTHNU_09920, partial [Gaiellales bacterium]